MDKHLLEWLLLTEEKPEKSQIVPEDYVRLRFPTQAQLSPDGQTLVFGVRRVKEKNNTYQQALYKWFTGSNTYQQLTSGTHTDSSPKWSPDGRYLAFLSGRAEDGAQIYAMPRDGGEAIRLTYLPKGVNAFSWGKMGTILHFIALVSEEELAKVQDPPKPPSFTLNPTDFEAFKARKKQAEELESDPRHIKEGYYRAGTSYFNQRFAHPFVLDFSFPGKTSIEEGPETTKPRSVADFGYHYTLGEFGTDDNILYLARVKDPTLSLYKELLAVTVATSDSTVLEKPFGWVNNIQVSPDGRYLTYESTREEQIVYDDNQIFLLSLESQQLTCLTEDYSRSAQQAQWVDESTLYFLSPRDGRVGLYSININTKEVQEVVGGDRSINEYTVSKGGNRLTYQVSHHSFFAELFTADLTGAGETQLTQVNKKYVEEHPPAKVEAYQFEREGIEFTGWVMTPHDHDGSKLPVVLEIHGGPAAQWTPHDQTMWHEWNCLAGAGYAVVFTNPRGSDGSGIEFRAAVHQNWGDVAGKDIMAGLDAALTYYDFLDGSNISVTGGSYGGYMTAWLTMVGFPERFKAAVGQRGVYEYVAFSPTTDIPLWFERQQGFELVDPERYPLYHRDSPAYHIQNLTCPLLIIHSDNDFRVPVVNGEQLFWFGKRYGKEVELVRYPRDGHELSRSGEPRHVIDRLRRIVGWFEKYAKS